MQTSFTLAQLADADVKESETILRTCVHCGFCIATCPTYVLLGDELDSPRGRIYLIKDMLEKNRPADARTVKHIDRCLSCLSCMTTCPSGVHYMHLVDHARAYIERTYARPLQDRAVRRLLGIVLPRPRLFRLSLVGAMLARPFAALLPARLAAMLRLAPASLPPPSRVDKPQVFPAEGETRLRVALLAGCAQQVLSPAINEATIRLLTRLGCEVAVARASGCCGALTHHLGQDAHGYAIANIRAWSALYDGLGPDRVVVNASGCGTTVKDYGFMLREDQHWATPAARIAAIARDVSEVLAELGLDQGRVRAPRRLRIAYHSACSLQHGQKIADAPKALLAAAGFEVADVPEGHLCCGSAGTYNLLQPELATQLRDRKVANIASVRPDAIAAGNIGCIAQIAAGTAIPVVHTIELLDWAAGGPMPAALGDRASSVRV